MGQIKTNTLGFENSDLFQKLEDWVLVCSYVYEANARYEWLKIVNQWAPGE